MRSGRARSGLSVAVLLCGTIAVRTGEVAAQAPPDDPKLDPADTIAPSKAGLYPLRALELWVDAGSYSDLNGVYHRSAGAGLELAIPSADQRYRVGFRAAATYGEWGDDDHDEFAFVPGMRARVSPLMYDLTDYYLLLKGDAVIGDVERDADPAIRLGFGGGVRFIRSFQIEGTVDWLVSPKGSFVQDGERSSGTVAFGMSAGFDLCSLGGCRKKVERSETKDHTCCLYQEALAVCTQAQAAKKAFCDAVEAALDSEKYPPEPDRDSTHAFLDGVAQELPRGGLKDAVGRVLDAHDELARQLEKNRHDARVAARSGLKLKRRMLYTPYPVELRRALGCGEPRACPSVEDVCETKREDRACK